jgi:tRNA A-37 threonylcarbamoyl transferase component Bud32
MYNTPEVLEGLRRFFLKKWPMDTMVAHSEDREVHCCVIGQDMMVYLKRYRISGIKPFLRTVLRVNKAQKAWRIGRRLRNNGIKTPLPIAILKGYASPHSLDYVVVTAGLPDAMDLYEAVRQVQGKHPSQQKRKRDLIHAVSKFVARLHGHHIYHGDFSADNILVRGDAGSQEMRVYVIDLDAVRTSFWISDRRRVKNLEELGRNFLDLDAISLADRVRFLKLYRAHYIRNKDNLYALFQKVRQRTEIRLARFEQSFGHRGGKCRSTKT